jgi:hypothetical protein
MTPKFNIIPIVFKGWYVDSARVNQATKGTAVAAKFIKPGGSAGTYKIRIRRHVVSLWTVDQIVEELPFEFTGNPVYQEIVFTPKFCTDESNTKGYYADLIKDGYVIWEMGKAYPPRLKVV